MAAVARFLADGTTLARLDELAAKSAHRGAALPDLLIAATAERHGVTVLHYDHEYDLIAMVTGQAVRWVVPRGTAEG